MKSQIIPVNLEERLFQQFFDPPCRGEEVGLDPVGLGEVLAAGVVVGNGDHLTAGSLASDDTVARVLKH